MHETNQSSYRIAVAIAVAAFCHAIALIVLSQVKWQPEIQRRIPFTLIVSGQDEPQANTNTTPRANAPQAVISISSDSPLVFRTPDSLPERPRSFRSPSADTSWIGKLFSAHNPTPISEPEATTEQEEVTQISTHDFPILGSYHLRLIQILARNKYHDDQYAFASLGQPRRVLLNLKLHSSGALLRVNVGQSSGDEDLDAAAQRSAYAASPFPPPPNSDESFNYTYPVEIQYQPRQKNGQ